MVAHEYRAAAVTPVLAEALGVTEAARKLGLSVKIYSKWMREARAGVLAHDDTQHAPPPTDLQAAVGGLNRELALACAERDILKNSSRGATLSERSGGARSLFGGLEPR